MEEKNNAVEKVENLTEDNKPEVKTKKTATGKGKVTTNPVKTTKKRSSTKQDEKKEKEKISKAERTEKARKKREAHDKKVAAKMQKKADREKARKAKQEVIKKKKEEYKTEKLRRKEERLARRDMLKHESREEREKRIAAEKQAKRRARENSKLNRIKLREQKASVRRQKIADRRALKEQKRELRMQNRREKRNRGLGGWLAAVIALGSTTLVLATLFTLSMTNVFDGMKINDRADVAESYYNLVDYVDNMDVSMSKLMVSNDKAQQQRLLGNLTTQASLAADDIARIPLKDESKYYTTKYINQVADYSKYLNNRLIDGDSITEADRENLSSLYSINTVLKEELSALNAEMGSEFDFNTILNEGDDNMFLAKFNALEEKAVDYPKLIYDGPFSDSVDKEEPEKAESITTREAEKKFSSIFAGYDIKNVESVGESEGKIDCYNVRADAVDGEIYASLAKTDGSLIMFNHYADCSEQNYSLEECIKKADEFMVQSGLSDMTAVWATENGATAYINYCYTQGGVIVYPDMVKVTVCKERGIVSAYDSTAYYLNHKQREIDEPTISQKEALTGLSTDLSVLATRLCLILRGETKEVLAYEVFGMAGDAEYYIYVDAKTGKEVQIFRVVSTSEGDLLM